MRIILRTLFSKAEQFLIKNNRDFCIESDESSRTFKKTTNKVVDDEFMQKDLGPYWDKLLADCGLPKDIESIEKTQRRHTPSTKNKDI